MYRLITIQGKYAAHYRFKEQSAQSFKDLIQGISGNSCAVISSRFRTDLIYLSDVLSHNEALKFWARYIKEDLSRKQRHLFIFKSGKEKVLNHYFTSLSKLCHIHDWYEEYVEEFNQLFTLDQYNPVLRMIAACDNFLVNNDQQHHRPPLVEKRISKNQTDDRAIISLLKKTLQKPEKNN